MNAIEGWFQGRLRRKPWIIGKVIAVMLMGISGLIPFAPWFLSLKGYDDLAQIMYQFLCLPDCEGAVIVALSPVGIFVLVVLNLFMVFLMLSFDTRRLHDAGYSGWFSLLGLVWGLVWLFIPVLAFLKSNEGANTYGDEPPIDKRVFRALLGK